MASRPCDIMVAGHLCITLSGDGRHYM